MIVPVYSFAFQPIVDVEQQRIVSYEALVRGVDEEPAHTVLNNFHGEALYRFDADARCLAIFLAGKLGLRCDLNLNLLPGSVVMGGTAPIDATVAAALRSGISPGRIVLELSEAEAVKNYAPFVEQLNRCRSLGVRFAIDDFGAGYSGLNLLSAFQPESIKLDMGLIRGIERNGPRQAIARGILRTCGDLGIDVVAEGVETNEELDWLRSEGIKIFQGYLFARPVFEQLPQVLFP